MNLLRFYKKNQKFFKPLSNDAFVFKQNILITDGSYDKSHLLSIDLWKKNIEKHKKKMSKGRKKQKSNDKDKSNYNSTNSNNNEKEVVDSTKSRSFGFIE